MLDWFKQILETGIQNNANEWHIPLDKPTFFRIGGATSEVDFTADNDVFVSLLQDLLPHNQLTKLEHDEGMAAVDGQRVCRVTKGESLLITGSKDRVSLLRFGQMDLYSRIRERLT